MGIASLSLHFEIGVNSLVILPYLCSFLKPALRLCPYPISRPSWLMAYNGLETGD
jgi:hypothetical protein